MVMEFGYYNICMNVIVVGLFKLEIINDLFQKEWLYKVVMKIVFVGKWGVVDLDLMLFVILFVSDDFQYIIGNMFIVDGGQSLFGLFIWLFL